MESKKIAIAGAGPAGGFSAYLLAKAGMDVRVFEEHGTIGEPVACTGVITGDVLSQRLQLPKELIVNRIAKARIIAPNKEFVEVKLKNDIIIDRAGLDRHISELAKDAGAKFFANHTFETFEDGNNGGSGSEKETQIGKSPIGPIRSKANWETRKVMVAVKDKIKNETKTVEANYLVGADGPISAVAKSAGLFGNRQFYVGLQATIPVENDNIIDFYPSEEGIAWVVPENEKIARVGIAAKKEASQYFKRFLTAVAGKDYEKKIAGRQAGPIPLYDPRLKSKTKDGRVLLVGDAATMVKAPTLGGINQSLIGAEAVAEAITKNADYEKLWKKRMGMDLYLSLLMRKAMERFSNEDYNRLVETFAREKNKAILESYDRDQPSRFALKLLMREPKLLLFAKKAWF
ncbi:NAD(P)/FAD-dependent oxidoreductase [Candidatus Woesearchaeota archaeon]|nr:NAD(P)/FAD-dependent oxidoreductase [Candidatus Woesearchaeota archaeon]